MDGTYGITMGPDGVDIDWPKVLTSDDALVAFIQDLRKFGIATSLKINNTTGEMVVITPGAKGIYQRGLYIESPNMADIAKQFAVTGEAYVQAPQPQSAWIFQREIKMTSSHYGQLHSAQLYDTTPFPAARSYASLSEELAQYIPDIHKRVRMPCSCGKTKVTRAQIWDVIQHLNDDHHPKKKINGLRRKDIWTRERIADWLDEVDADLAFDPDLPAKRAAQRQAARKAQAAKMTALVEQGIISASAAHASLEALVKPAQETTTGMVKLSVAMKQFESTIHKMIDGPLDGCECMTCTTVKHTNQEES